MSSNNDDAAIQILAKNNEFAFIFGASEIVEYIVKNTSKYPVQVTTVNALTVVKVVNKDEYVPTKQKYASVILSPSIIYPQKDEMIRVKVDVPFENKYSEIVLKDGVEYMQPFRLGIEVKGFKVVKEL